MDSGLEWFELFIEIYNMGAALVMLFMISHILIMLRRVDKNLLKARVFLKEDILNDTWLYVSIACAAFALHSIVGILGVVAEIRIPSIYEVSEIIFIMAFIIMIYQWYGFIASLRVANAPVEQ
ncbi:MAG: hypothetical protein KAH86_04710 [Methanosarcinales archaeon]|nr:hypothetical protein [Methanosarcinales archaeon]